MNCVDCEEHSALIDPVFSCVDYDDDGWGFIEQETFWKHRNKPLLSFNSCVVKCIRRMMWQGCTPVWILSVASEPFIFFFFFFFRSAPHWTSLSASSSVFYLQPPTRVLMPFFICDVKNTSDFRESQVKFILLTVWISNHSTGRSVSPVGCCFL